ncbi:ABC transporter ATP-binding protein [Mangrovicoccus algicola]|uniref:ABC transporter ATP-binding protein n=1 Tax=Mangrovicoccus algicola TaxID=2771008 RepID=A0A8J6YZ21_9RHOB|nr:ABC transporter ATP-binding protein [Mangrovicoccus algicola]MBE3640652.1 ABC transporter ATP-binding protein [Mangrovicoccus algicola]
MLLDARDIVKTFPGDAGLVPVLDGVSLSLAAGETMALTGESGSGKSTLLTLLAGLDRPDGGTVLLEGRDLGALGEAGLARIRRGRIGLIFQQFNLVPSLSAGQNIALQARLAGRHDPDWCAALACRLGLAPHLGKYPEALSGGQQQRVAVARTLAVRPQVILADEPTGNLDEATGDAVLAGMLELVAETGAGLVMVTHSPRLAARLSRRLHLARGRLA